MTQIEALAEQLRGLRASLAEMKQQVDLLHLAALAMAEAGAGVEKRLAALEDEQEDDRLLILPA